MTSSPRMRPHSSNALLDVSTVEACSYRWLTSGEKRVAPPG